MKITKNTDREVIIEDFPKVLSIILFCCAVFSLVALVKSFHEQPVDARAVLGTSLGFLICGLGFALLFKKSMFVFDLSDLKLKWTRKGLFKNEGGEIFFDEIEKTVIETIDSNHSLSYRLVLITKRGTIPLTMSYQGNKEHHLNVARHISRILGKDCSILIDDSIRALVKKDRIIDAHRFAQQEYNVGQTEAHDLVSKIKDEKMGP